MLNMKVAKGQRTGRQKETSERKTQNNMQMPNKGNEQQKFIKRVNVCEIKCYLHSGKLNITVYQ